MLELTLVDQFSEDTDYRAAERQLGTEGWVPCGAGDWAVALRSPSGAYAARISPFDPAAPYNAELYRRAADTGAVPRLYVEQELEGGAHLIALELLHPVTDLDRAVAFHQAVSAGDSGRTGLGELSRAVVAVHDLARRELPRCGPVDTSPSNVMESADGRLVLIDPFFADGPGLFGTILTDPARVTASIPASRRRHMFGLPLTSSGPPAPGELDRMRRALAAAED